MKTHNKHKKGAALRQAPFSSSPKILECNRNHLLYPGKGGACPGHFKALLQKNCEWEMAPLCSSRVRTMGIQCRLRAGVFTLWNFRGTTRIWRCFRVGACSSMCKIVEDEQSADDARLQVSRRLPPLCPKIAKYIRPPSPLSQRQTARIRFCFEPRCFTPLARKLQYVTGLVSLSRGGFAELWIWAPASSWPKIAAGASQTGSKP